MVDIIIDLDTLRMPRNSGRTKSRPMSPHPERDAAKRYQSYQLELNQLYDEAQMYLTAGENDLSELMYDRVDDILDRMQILEAHFPNIKDVQCHG